MQSEKLPDDVRAWLLSRYELEDATLHNEGVLYWPERGRVLSPVYDVAGVRFGYAARAVTSGYTGPKSLTVVQNPAWVGGAFTRTSADSPVVMLVEDVFSSYAVAEYGFRGCALLGVHVTDDLEAALSNFDEVIVALDNDATGRAAELVHRLSYMNIRQLPLPKDIKDMSAAERASFLSEV